MDTSKYTRWISEAIALSAWDYDNMPDPLPVNTGEGCEYIGHLTGKSTRDPDDGGAVVVYMGRRINTRPSHELGLPRAKYESARFYPSSQGG